jgi:hypothetical protein
MTLSAADASASREGLRIESDGAQALVSFFGGPAVARAAAYTQTYATASRAHANLTASTLTDNTTGTADTTVVDVGTSFSQVRLNNNFADLIAQINNLRTDLDNVKQVLTSVIDDLQAYRLLQ